MALLAASGLALALWLATGSRTGARRGGGAPPERSGPARAAELDGGPDTGSEGQREGVADAPPTTSTLVLELVRHPDGAVLADVALATEPPVRASGAAESRTDAHGRVALEVPAGTTELVVSAVGYEPERVPLAPGPRAQRVALVPSFGLFGRVVRADGGAAAGAELALVRHEDSLFYASNATRASPYASVARRSRTVAKAVANAEGAYYVACATRDERATLELRATDADGRSAQLAVELPREPAALADLVLAEPERVRVRVVDLAERPLSGVRFLAGRTRFAGVTDADGEAMLAASLPVLLWPEADGHRLHERRHDGVTVGAAQELQSAATRVELVMAPALGATLRVVDARNGMPVYLGHGRVDLLRGGEPFAWNSFEVDRTGKARLQLYSAEEDVDAEPPELARVHYEREGYRDALLELDPRALVPGAELLLELEPEPDFACIRGRVMRAGVPVPGLQVGLRAQARSEGAPARSWQYSRAYSDDEGRFALRWRAGPGVVVTVFPHWFQYDEFAFIGPLDGERAAEGEHVLELLPSVRVPAVLRGVASGGTYLYYVSVLDETGALAVSTTINGAPMELAPGDLARGEARTRLLLPSQRRVSVRIGTLAGNSVRTDGSAAVEHDPLHPVLPLVFEVQPLFARLSGRVVGLSDDELATATVAFQPGRQDEARLARPAADGSFELASLPLGPGCVYLGCDEPPRHARILARVELELTGDRAGLVLAPDPGSLPEASAERR